MKKLEDPRNIYDIIVNINAMKSLLDKGWKEECSEKGFMRYEEKKDKESVVVSVIGNANKGKSFLLAKLSDIVLPSGYEIQTKGLSVKYPTIANKNIILLDTAGFQTPLVENDVYKLSKDKEELKEEDYINEVTELSRDKQMTECLLQKFVLTQANILICVVGELTYSEQKFLNKIKRDTKDKRLFVVHNLQNLTEKKQVEKYINEILMKSLTFKLKDYIMIDFEKKSDDERKNENDKYYLEQFEDENEEEDETRMSRVSGQDIVHLIMANDGSEAGKFYNNSTINYLKNQIATFVGIKKFPIEEKIREFLFNISSEIMEDPIKDIDDIIIGKNCIKLDTSKENKFKLKKCLIDELGINSFVGTKYKPKYRYYKSSDGKLFYIQFIMCGGVSELRVKINLVGEYYFFIISGRKTLKNEKEEKQEKQEGTLIEKFSKREEGYFLLEIKVSSNLILLSNNKVKNKKKENGIVTLEFDLLGQDN